MSISVVDAAKILRDAMRDEIRRHSTWYLIQGGLMVLAGIFALLFPLFSSLALVSVLGWLLVISGIFQGISLIGARHVPHFWVQLLSLVLGLIVGFLFITRPGESLLTLTLLLIVFFMVEGFSKIIFALSIRPLPHWGWVLLSGIVGVLLSALLWSQMPLTAFWLLGLLVGINLVSQGAALGYMAWRVRSAV